MQPDIKMTARLLMSVQDFAALSGQTPAAIRSQIRAGTCPVDVVVLRKPDPGRAGGRPRYAVTRASVDRLRGLEASP